MVKHISGLELDYKSRYVAGGIIVFVILVFVLDHLNERFWLNDFKVYYGATKALFSGEIVYGVPFGLSSGFYKYSPFALLFYFPLTLFPYYTASILFFIFLSILNLKSPFSIGELINPKNDGLVETHKWLFYLMIFVVVASHIHRELHLGNINIVLLSLFILALRQILSNEKLVGGCIIGLGILFKPHFVILLPLLIIWKKWRSILGVVISLFTGFAIPGLMFGWVKNWQLHNQWFKAMADHNSNLLDGINTIYFYPALSLKALGLTSIDFVGIIILLMVAVGVGMLHFYRKLYHFKEDESHELRSFKFEYVLLLGLVPSLTITDTEHFLLSMPLIAYCLYCWNSMKLKLWQKALMILGFLCYGGNWGDLIGNFSKTMSNYGLIGIGNVIVIGLAVNFYLVSLKNMESNQK